MNDKSRMILKILAGGYILYIGISLLIGVLQTEPNEKVLMIFVSIFFMAVGSTVLYFSGRALLKEYGIDIEFWKKKKEHPTAETEEDQEAAGEVEEELDTATIQEDHVPENEQEEPGRAEEQGKEEQNDTDSEERKCEEQSVEEAAEEAEPSAMEESGSSDTGEEQTDIEIEEEKAPSAADASEEKPAEQDAAGQQEEEKEENPTEKLFRRRQASISPMPQRRS